MGWGASKTMVSTLRTLFGGTETRLDCPERVWVPTTQVARTRTGPWLAGTLGSTQEPSGCTRAVRLRALTRQWSSSWAARGGARAPSAATSAAARRLRLGDSGLRLV